MTCGVECDRAYRVQEQRNPPPERTYPMTHKIEVTFYDAKLERTSTATFGNSWGANPYRDALEYAARFDLTVKRLVEVSA